MMIDLLEAGLDRLAQNGLSLPSGLKAQMERYLKEIELFNPVYKLVGTNNRSELIVRHLFDSLAPLGILRSVADSFSANAEPGETQAPSIADLGSGAGLPGIPLAAAWPEAEFVLIERMAKRAVFLENAIIALGLTNVKVECVEAERAVANRFQIIVFRAYKALDEPMLVVLRRLLKPEGLLAAYKGRRERIDEELTAIKACVADWEIIPLSPPFLDEPRHLVLIRF